MFGSTALAENSISDQGIVAFGSGSASANFTKTTATSVTFLGSMSVIGTSSKVIAASGLCLESSMRLLILHRHLQQKDF